MYKRSYEDNVYSPDELSVLSSAFERACTECNLTGALGRDILAKALFQRFRHGVTREDDLVKIARIIVWRRRGLGPGLHVIRSPRN